MNTEAINHIISAVSAFMGAASVMAYCGWWLRSQFGKIYDKMDEHEIQDVKRFHALEMKILENKIQAQTLESVKHSQGTL